MPRARSRYSAWVTAAVPILALGSEPQRPRHGPGTRFLVPPMSMDILLAETTWARESSQHLEAWYLAYRGLARSGLTLTGGAQCGRKKAIATDRE